MNARIVGSIVAVSALFPLERLEHQRKPGGISEQPDGDLRFEPAFFGKARFPETVSLVGLEVQGAHVVENQAGRAEPGTGRTRRGQLTPELRSCVAGQPAGQGAIGGSGYPDFLEHSQRVQFAGRLDDPSQDKIPKHIVSVRN